MEDADIKEFVVECSKDFFEMPSRIPLLKIAQTFMNLQRPQEAVCYAGAALQIMDDGSDHGDMQHFYEDMPHRILYWGLEKIGDRIAAQQHFIACLGYQPLDQYYLRDLRTFFDVKEGDWIKHGDITDDEFLKAYKIAGDSGKKVALFNAAKYMIHKSLVEKYPDMNHTELIKQAHLHNQSIQIHGLHTT